MSAGTQYLLHHHWPIDVLAPTRACTATGCAYHLNEAMVDDIRIRPVDLREIKRDVHVVDR